MDVLFHLTSSYTSNVCVLALISDIFRLGKCKSRLVKIKIKSLEATVRGEGLLANSIPKQIPCQRPVPVLQLKPYRPSRIVFFIWVSVQCFCEGLQHETNQIDSVYTVYPGTGWHDNITLQCLYCTSNQKDYIETSYELFYRPLQSHLENSSHIHAWVLPRALISNLLSVPPALTGQLRTKIWKSLPGSHYHRGYLGCNLLRGKVPTSFSQLALETLAQKLQRQNGRSIQQAYLMSKWKTL